VAADERAETHLQRALELVGRARPSPQRDRRELQATAQLVVVRQRRLGVTEASNQALFERVRELSHSVGPSPELLATGIFEWGFHILRGSFGTARAVAGNLLELGAQTGESSFSAVGSVALGETLLAMGDAEGALTALQHAVVLADADPAIADHLSMDLRSLSRSFLLIVYAERGDEARCRSVTDEAVAYAAARPYDEVHLRSCTVLAAVILRDPHWALAEARAGIRRAQTHSYAFYGAMLEASAAWGTGLTDDVELGIERFDQALAQLDAAGLRLMRPLHEGLRAELALLAGRLDEAGEHATRGLRVAEAGERHFVPALHTLHARILAAGGDRAGAAGALDRARRLAPPGTVYLDQARAAGIELGLDVADLVDG